MVERCSQLTRKIPLGKNKAEQPLEESSCQQLLKIKYLKLNPRLT